MDALEVSASSLLANVPLTKERHKTKLRFQELKKETAFLDRKGGRDTLQKTMHIKRCEHIWGFYWYISPYQFTPERWTGELTRGSYLGIDILEWILKSSSVDGLPWISPLLQASSSCESLPLRGFGNCAKVDVDRGAHGQEGGSKMRVALVKGNKWHWTRWTDRSWLFCFFFLVLLPATGQRAQNKSGYSASWKQKVEGFKPEEWARGKVLEMLREEVGQWRCWVYLVIPELANAVFLGITFLCLLIDTLEVRLLSPQGLGDRMLSSPMFTFQEWFLGP